MASTRHTSGEEQNRLSLLFHTYDVDNSGRIKKNEFSTICQELHVPAQEVDEIFNRLDVDRDGTVTLEEFISGFKEQHLEEEGDAESKNKNSSKSEGELSKNKEQVISRWDIIIYIKKHVYCTPLQSVMKKQPVADRHWGIYSITCGK